MSKKGSNYERIICKSLSAWWSNDPDNDDEFWRSSQSGGRATTRAKKDKETKGHAGDIVATGKYGRRFLKHIAVEIKAGYNNVPNATITNCMTSKESFRTWTLIDWIKQVKRSQKMSKSAHWIIIHKLDRREPLVYVNWSLFRIIKTLLRSTKFTGHVTLPVKGKVTKVGYLKLSTLYKVDPRELERALKSHD